MKPEAVAQFGLHAFPLAEGALQGRGFDFDVAKADGRIQLDVHLARGLADHLLASLALLRHRDQQISLH